MKRARASGKGGTGKTTVAAALFTSWSQDVVGMDLDVEEPNLHLFLKPEVVKEVEKFIDVPEVDSEKCNGCGACADFCQYRALSVMNGKAHVFEEMCHACGGCFRLCPQNALVAKQKLIGLVREGRVGKKRFLMGCLEIGVALTPMLIAEVKRQFNGEGDLLMDAPPGTTCPAMSAVLDADFIVLVSEPTPFGLYDLKLAVEAFRPLGAKMGLVINKSEGFGALHKYAESEKLPILGEIPFKREIAEGYSRGEILTAIRSESVDVFRKIEEGIRLYA